MAIRRTLPAHAEAGYAPNDAERAARTRPRSKAVHWTWVRHNATERSLDLLLIVLILFMVAPVLFLVVSSFKTREEVTSGSALLPSVWLIGNYPEMWGRVRFGGFLLNSLI